MTRVTPEDVRLLRILASGAADGVLQEALRGQTCDILREYHRENTMLAGTAITEQLRGVGVTEEQGKAAVAAARRLGASI